MKTVKVIEPKGSEKPGTVHTIPESDLEGFLEAGWELEEEKSTKKNK
jgi:hypothetical protein